MTDNIENVLIVGGGTAGWMTACILCKRLKHLNITLIESSDIPVVGVGEATIIHMTEFLKEMGLGEKDWMRQCNATYKESIYFENFYAKGHHYWHPFLRIHPEVSDYWVYKYRKENINPDSYFDYCYDTTVLNANNKINLENKINFHSIKKINYTYHLDAAAFGQFLKNHIALKNGVKHIVDDVLDVTLKLNGFVDHIVTRNSGNLSADLFIDCTGFSSLLLGKALQDEFDSYLEKVPNDKAIAVRMPYVDKDKEMHPFTTATALEAGWVWNIPLWSRLGTGYVYSSAYTSKDQAELELRQYLGEQRVKDLAFHHINMRIGRYKNPWTKNVVAIGLSAGFIEPLESTGIELAQGGAQLLEPYLQTSPNSFVSRVSYNEKMKHVYDEIVDYIQLHYILTNREDTPYWRDQKYEERPLSDRLRFDLLRHESSFNQQYDARIFLNTAWSSILIGMRRIPTLQDLTPINPAKFAEVNREMLAYYRSAKKRAADRVNGKKNPSHYEFLKNRVYKD